MPLKQEFELSQPPSDGITNVCFSPAPNSAHLLASSWDSSVRLYDATQNTLQLMHTHQYAILDCCFAEPDRCVSGGIDRKVNLLDFHSQSESLIGSHEDTVRCVEYCPELGLLVSGSWDKTVKLWDLRQRQAVGTYDQNGESIFTMALSGDRLVVGTSSRRVLVWHLRNMQFAEQRRASSLKYQTRCLRCFPNGQGFVLSSIEGRVAVEYLDTDQEAQKKKYAFKCHRMKQDGVEHIYPVNAISFHSKHNTFATGGSDGFVNVWDPFNKKRLCQFHRYPTDISCLAFNSEGTMIAIAASAVQVPEDEKDKVKDAIFIRHISDNETLPK